MFQFAFLSVLVAVVTATPMTQRFLDDEWVNFKHTYSKTYAQEEKLMRRLIWEDNVRFIQKHNMEADRGLHTYTVGVNEYADMTVEEFRRFMNGYVMRNTSDSHVVFTGSEQVMEDSVDWRTKGYVTPVKNQKQCGSCWAFSAIGSLEGQHFKKAGKLVSLSEQNLVDCSKRQGNQGCEGGLMDAAFKYIKANEGIDTEASYPYTGRNEKCKFKKEDVGATDTGHVDLKARSETALQQAVSTIGPISVAMDANHQSFQLYKSGIYSEKKCSSKKLDHGVLAVGYGAEEKGDYWIVKNSWGESWGMKGYFNMARNKANMCGIATQASYPLV